MGHIAGKVPLMPLQYDFDIAAVPGTAPVAMWRDPEVLAALRRADPVVQKYFRDSGFGAATYDSGAPSGRYPEADEEPRADIIGKLTTNVHHVDVEGLNWGGFDLRAFLGYLGTAEPIAASQMPAPPKREPRPVTPVAEARVSQPETSPTVSVTDNGEAFEFDEDDIMRAMQPSRAKGLAMVGLALGVILIGVAALMALD
ncbi:hypothetical protein ACJ5NV_07825 [Loktanella agnita]|uniref:hypothetical protein n=1 Tax=Loktanella agnita TaxID=287097 RepID=UPI00398837A2